MTILELSKRFKEIFGFNPPIDRLMTAVRGPNRATIDIIKLDNILAKKDNEYNNEKCTYKDKSGYSVHMYIKEKYGEDAAKFINSNI